MIVWGGSGPNGTVNTGGRYNPSTNSWTTTSSANAPEGRWFIIGAGVIAMALLLAAFHFGTPGWWLAAVLWIGLAGMAGNW